MRGLFSLEQELRSIRRGSGAEKKNGAKSEPAPQPSERPWQPDIDLVQQTMREVLRAVAGLAGVELPGLPGGLQDDPAAPPPLAIQTLKDRIRNELEGFSIKATEEVTARAEEQTRAALDVVRNESGSQIDEFAAELREKLQQQLGPEGFKIDAAQVNQFLEPRLAETAARLEGLLAQKVEQSAAEQQRFLQEEFQESLSSFQERLSALEQAVQEVCKLNEELMGALPSSRPDGAAEPAMGEPESGVTAQAEGEPSGATTPTESPVDVSLEPSSHQPEEVPPAQPEEQPQTPTVGATDIQSRLKRAGELLAGLELEKLRRRPG